MDLCRLCGISASQQNDNMLNIFGKDEYAAKIKSCIPLLMYRTDPLSKNICRSCFAKIDDFCKFKKLVIENNRQVISSLRNVQNDEDGNIRLYLTNFVQHNKNLNNDKVSNYLDMQRKKSTDSSSSSSSSSSTSSSSSSLSSAANSIQNKRLKILTPQNINDPKQNHIIKPLNELDSEEAKQKEIFIKSIDLQPQQFRQPKTLLQLALHSFNLTINPNYVSEHKLRKKIYENKRQFIEFERKWKLSLSSSRIQNKRIFDQCVPGFTDLLTAWEPPIKQIKLESYNPLAPEICLVKKDLDGDEEQNSDYERSNYETDHIDIMLKYPRNRCRYCFKDFCDMEQLALHEAKGHIQVFVGAKIDSEVWQDYEDNMNIRDKWLKKKIIQSDMMSSGMYNSGFFIKEELISDGEEEYEEMNGHYDENDETVAENDRTVDENGEEIDLEPLDTELGRVGEIPFHTIEKRTRFLYYKSVETETGRRRECPFCLKSFKDSWSVDEHIMKNRCRFICPFCSKYFKKDTAEIQDEFFNHLYSHKNEPGYHPATKRWRKNIVRAQQLLRQQHMKERMEAQQAQRLKYQQQQQAQQIAARNRIEPLRMKYLMDKRQEFQRQQQQQQQLHRQQQQRMQMQQQQQQQRQQQQQIPQVQIKQEPGEEIEEIQPPQPIPINPAQLLEIQYSGTPGAGSPSGSVGAAGSPASRSTKPYRAYYCRNCYHVFYQEQELKLHYPKCCEQNTDTDNDIQEIKRSEYHHITPQPDRTADHSVVIQNEVFRCGFCPAVFYNSNARNSHMRVHKESMLRRRPPPGMVPPPGQQFHHRLMPRPPVRPQPPPPEKPRVIDENLARLVSNPHITIKPSGGQPKRPPPPPENFQINSILEPVVEMSSATPQLRSYQCIPCGQSYAGQRALYEHKRTCAAAIATSQANANAAKANAANAGFTSYEVYQNDSGPQAGYMEMPLENMGEVGGGAANQRRFRCTGCGKRFYTKANLYFHRKNVCNTAALTRVFECPFCKKKFTTESQYTTHILYNHPE